MLGFSCRSGEGVIFDRSIGDRAETYLRLIQIRLSLGGLHLVFPACWYAGSDRSRAIHLRPVRIEIAIDLPGEKSVAACCRRRRQSCESSTTFCSDRPFKQCYGVQPQRDLVDTPIQCI